MRFAIWHLGFYNIRCSTEDTETKKCRPDFPNIFPLSGQIRLSLIIIEWIVFLFSLELGVIFYIRYRNQTTKIRSKEEIGYVTLFLGFSLMTLFFIKSDYFSSYINISPYLIWDFGSERQLYLNFGYFFLLFGAFLFIYIVEIKQNFSKNKEIFYNNLFHAINYVFNHFFY